MGLFKQRQPQWPMQLQVPVGQIAKVMLEDASVIEVEPTGQHSYKMPKGSRLISVGPPEQSGIQEVQP